MCLLVKYLIICLSIVPRLAAYNLDEVKITFNSFNYSKFSNLTRIFEEIPITDLTIKDSPFPQITRQTFQKFKSVQTLVLDNTRTEKIDDNAFVDLPYLKNLHIVNNNNLSTFKSDVFNSTSLAWLDISNNSLKSLTDFNVKAIPTLLVLNISYNSLEYLPIDIVDKLRFENKFYVIVDNNPWNCSHPEWKQYLTDELTMAFCSDLATIKIDSYEASEEVDLQQKKFVNSSTSGITRCNEGKFKEYCPFWIFGAVWVGVILGNVRTLKRLICCPTTITKDDKTTQCDKMDVIITTSKFQRQVSSVLAP